MRVDFKEEQKFSQWWLWLILIAITCIPAIGLYKQVLLKESFGSKPISNTGLYIFLASMLFCLLLFWLLRLKTSINQKEIQFSFFPFVKKKVLWEDVQNAEVINYGFVGGWGIRIGTSYGTVYNVKGNTGLYVQLKDGNKFVIGTQIAEELDRFIQSCPLT